MKQQRTANKGFCVRRAEVQNSTAVFQLNISKNIGFCASKSATSHTRKPLAASVNNDHATTNRLLKTRKK